MQHFHVSNYNFWKKIYNSWYLEELEETTISYIAEMRVYRYDFSGGQLE